MDESGGIDRRVAVVGLGMLGLSMIVLVGTIFYRITTFTPPPRKPAPLVLSPADLARGQELPPHMLPQAPSAVQAATYEQERQNNPAPQRPEPDAPRFVAPQR